MRAFHTDEDKNKIAAEFHRDLLINAEYFRAGKVTRASHDVVHGYLWAQARKAHVSGRLMALFVADDIRKENEAREAFEENARAWSRATLAQEIRAETFARRISVQS